MKEKTEKTEKTEEEIENDPIPLFFSKINKTTNNKKNDKSSESR